MKTITIAKEELVNVLNNVKGAKFAHVTLLTEPKMNKRNNPYFGKVTKKQNGIVMFNASYQNAVNNHLAKQGEERDFVADALPWGKWETPNKLITHKGEMYVRFYSVKNCRMSSTFYLMGKRASKKVMAIIKMFLPKVSESAKQAAKGLAFEEQVKPFTTKLANIQSIVINGNKYVLQ